LPAMSCALSATPCPDWGVLRFGWELRGLILHSYGRSVVCGAVFRRLYRAAVLSMPTDLLSRLVLTYNDFAFRLNVGMQVCASCPPCTPPPPPPPPSPPPVGNCCNIGGVCGEAGCAVMEEASCPPQDFIGSQVRALPLLCSATTIRSILLL
jgi:hypothetical protein